MMRETPLVRWGSGSYRTHLYPRDVARWDWTWVGALICAASAAAVLYGITRLILWITEP